jgi:hypothetical protein
MVSDASLITRADITAIVSRSDAWACVAISEVFNMATGLSTSSPLPTSQSSAFLSDPGTPWAYSGC